MLPGMFKRQTTGSVVCASCGSLVGVNDEQCYNCGRRNPGLWGWGPVLRRLGNDFGFVTIVLYGCSALYALGLILTVALGGNVMGGGNPLGMLSPAPAVNLMLGSSGARPVFGFGFWWSVLSAGWLHGSVLHILFNMMWVRDLGPVTAEAYGPARMVIIYTVSSACGFLLSSVMGLFPIPFFGADQTVGASAPIFGLLGALVLYGQRGGGSMLHAQVRNYAIVLFVMGFIIPSVDNAAHAGGFIGGFLTALLLDSRKPERVNHMVGALVCIGLTVLAIAASVLSVAPTLFA